MQSLINTFIEKKPEWIKALVEHLKISMTSLIIAILVAITLAILISKNKKLSEVVLQITGIMQTIPSLALLGLFIPIMGIGTLPAVVALVLYAVFPILQNTITGFNEIDPSLKEAATAFGMTRFEKLKKFELELAMPTIVSGIRTSAVMIIGTATLAALVGAGGLGSFILLGIDRNNPHLILIGAISSALLAIIFNFAIKRMQNKKPKVILITLLILGLIVGLSYVRFNPMTQKTVTIAGKLGAEPDILINMYKEVIEDNSDLNVSLKPNFGKTSFLYEALKAREIDIYPEFSGTISESLIKDKMKLESNDPRAVYEKSRDLIYNQDKLVYLEPMKFQNTYALAVKKDFAKKHNLEKISDLKKIENEINAGFTLEFNDRDDGNKGLKSLYGLNLKVRTMEPSLRYQAIGNGDINLTDVYSTDSQIRKYDLVILKDDMQLFPPYQGAPLMREDTLKKYPEIKDALMKLKDIITEEEMSQMNYDVDINGKSPAEVAHEYLKKKGIVK